VYALTKEFPTIAQFIHTSAGTCRIEEAVDFNDLLPDDTRIQWYKALWDTGATQSCISDRLAEELGLEAEDFVKVATASGIVRLPIYTLHLALPNHIVFDSIEVIEFAYGDDDCDLIIGMDIMTQGDLAMTNQAGRTVFSFRIPSLHTVDFEAEWEGREFT
jgi:gag-polyprotein putative aspartyl protease